MSRSIFPRLPALAAALLAFALGPAHAAVRILACEPEWGALAQELGGKLVDVAVATSALQDPHQIQAKPSLISRARNADLVVCTGAELEIGWLPVLIQESGNSRIQPGGPGYFEAASLLDLVEKPAHFDRALGDIHPYGNPHVQLDPHNIARVAKALAERLAQLDGAHADYYQQRAKDFDTRWQAAIQRWESKAAPLKGKPIVVMHTDQSYLCRWLGLQQVAAIEPKPGMPPTAGYLGQLVTKLKASPPQAILVNAYNDPKAAKWLSERVNAPVITLPFSVGGSPEAKDLFGLFDDTLNKLLAVLK
jgi:zinc/manganese transport system substrate-binding protein